MNVHGEGRFKDEHRQKDVKNDVRVKVCDGRVCSNFSNLLGEKTEKASKQQQQNGVGQGYVLKDGPRERCKTTTLTKSF